MNIHWMQRDHWPCTNSGLRQMAKELEDIGICSVLLPYGPGSEDFIVHIPDIFRDTKKIRMMVAVGAYSVTPEYLIRTFDSMQFFGKDRLDLNLVAGRYVEEFENRAIESYPGDTELINNHDKRVALTEKWMDKFAELVKKKNYQTRLAVVGKSDTTIGIANKHTDYLITNPINLYNPDYVRKVTNCSHLVVINPLILQEGQSESDIEYDDTKFALKGGHWPHGNYQEVLDTVKGIIAEFSVNDIMIHTDQKDISQIVRLVKELLQDTVTTSESSDS